MKYIVAHVAGPHPGQYVKNKDGTGYTTDPNEAVVIGARSKVAYHPSRFVMVPVKITLLEEKSDGS